MKKVKQKIVNFRSLVGLTALYGAVVFSCVGGATALAQSDVFSANNLRTITVTGTGQVKAEADTALLTLSAIASHKKSSEAKRAVDIKVNQLIDVLMTYDIEKSDISASRIRTSAQYEYQPNKPRELKGYRATRDIKIKLVNLASLSSIMDEALKLGINEVQNIEYLSSKAPALKREALALATKNATEQATWLANSFGATLGPVRVIDTLSIGHTVPNQNRGGIEMMKISAVASNNDEGQYLADQLSFDAKLKVVFDLNVEPSNTPKEY